MRDHVWKRLEDIEFDVAHQRHARDGALLRQCAKDCAQVIFKYDQDIDMLVAIKRTQLQDQEFNRPSRSL